MPQVNPYFADSDLRNVTESSGSTGFAVLGLLAQRSGLSKKKLDKIAWAL